MAIQKSCRSFIVWALCAFAISSSWARHRDQPDRLPDIYNGYEARLDSVIAIANMLERGTKDRQLAVSYAMLVRNAALLEGIDPELLAAVVMTESYADRHAISVTGAVGLGQIVPGLWHGVYPNCGEDLFNAKTNLCYSSKILRLYIDKSVSLLHALNRYSGYYKVYGFGDEPSPYTKRIDYFSESL